MLTMSYDDIASGCSRRRADQLIAVKQLCCIIGLVMLQLPTTTAQCSGDNSAIDFIANNLRVNYQVVRNYNTTHVTFASGLIKLTNSAASGAILPGKWEIYFTALRNYSTHVNSNNQFQVRHVNGVLFKLVHTSSFSGLNPGQTIDVPVSYNIPTVSRTDAMPNWYVTQTNCSDPTMARVISSTAGEDLSFVAPFTIPEQWKRDITDQYNPYTPQERYSNAVTDEGQLSTRWRVIPTPANVSLDSSRTVDIKCGGWVIVEPPAYMQLDSEVLFLSEALNLPIRSPNKAPASKTVHLGLGPVQNPLNSDESYLLNINTVTKNITIIGSSSAGVFYGIQSLISLSYPDGRVAEGTVTDWPRFQHRGHMIDVARNFHSKVSDVKKMIDAMAMYKMNRLHFHLGDDEGWRLEIPQLPELTEVGGRRCHDLTESQCVITQLGSTPNGSNSGTGWYTVDEYKDILSYAQRRHVKVIPEFDMPGHAHAAIVAMVARYRKTGDSSFLLSDPNDSSEYFFGSGEVSNMASPIGSETRPYHMQPCLACRSVQQFTDNAINPCINSTYTFIEHVIRRVIEMHRGIQDLTIYHFGGDEVPAGAWTQSPACQRLNMTSAELKAYFVRRVSEISASLGVDLACWEDGLFSGGDIINRTRLPNNHTYANAWDNVWQWGVGKRAYDLANAGYKVILSHATHFYFDFPIEADPEERGLYWATRAIPLKRAFSYQPDSVYDNIDLDVMGNVLSKAEICTVYGCSDLLKPDNIVGIQSQVFSETARLATHFQSMSFPRVIAVAERSWHRAVEWEQPQSASNKQAELLRDADWRRFANTLAYKELRRLDDIGITYRVPPPGARINEQNELTAVSELPGLNIRYSLDGGTWQNWTGVSIRLKSLQKARLVAMSTDGSRMSRYVEVQASYSEGSVNAANPSTLLYHVISLKLFLFCLIVHSLTWRCS